MTQLKFANKLLSIAGGISLELYITHVTVRRIFSEADLPIWLFKYYAAVIIIAIVLSVALRRVDNLILRKNIYL